MPGAQYRIRSRVKRMLDGASGISESTVLQRVALLIDEEIERDAEFEFTRPMNPDPVTAQAKELKDGR